MGSRREDGGVIVLQDFQPVGDVGTVVLAGLQHDDEIGAQERRAQFGTSTMKGAKDAQRELGFIGQDVEVAFLNWFRQHQMAPRASATSA